MFPYFWHTHANFDGIDLAAALPLWREQRNKLLAFASALTDEARAFTGSHSTFGDFTVAGLLTIALEHDEEHIADLSRDIAAFRSTR